MSSPLLRGPRQATGPYLRSQGSLTRSLRDGPCIPPLTPEPTAPPAQSHGQGAAAPVLVAVSVGTGFGGLDARVDSFEQAVVELACAPGDDAVPVPLHQGDELLDRLQA